MRAAVDWGTMADATHGGMLATVTAWLRLSRACNNACVFCSEAEHLDGVARKRAEVLAEIGAAKAAGATRVVLSGGEPTLSAWVIEACTRVRDLGMRAALATNGRVISSDDLLRRLVHVGLNDLLVSIHGSDAATHGALVGGSDVAWEQATRTVALAVPFEELLVTVRTVLTRSNQHQIPDLVRFAREHGTRFELRQLQATGRATASPELRVDDVEALALRLSTHALARSLGVPFQSAGFGDPRLLHVPADSDPIHLDPLTAAMRKSGIVGPPLTAGLLAPPARWWSRESARRSATGAEIAAAAAADHLPFVDLPPCLGGASRGARPRDRVAACTPCTADCPGPPIDLKATFAGAVGPLPPWAPIPPGARIVVVNGPQPDPWVAMSTLPALVHALRARGADVTLHSAWSAPFDPAALEPVQRATVLGRVRRAIRRPPTVAEPNPLTPGGDAWRQAERRLEELSLGGADVVITAGLGVLARLADNPTWPAQARAIVLDTDGLGGLGTLPPRWELHSPDPGYHPLHRLAGLPTRQIHWRPLPLHLPHLPVGPPGGDHVFLAADAALDPDQLAGGLAHGHRVLAWGEAVAGCERFATDTLSELYDAVRRARFLWLPWAPVRHRAPPSRWISLALAAGTPVLASAVPASVSGLRHQSDSLLTLPGQRQSTAGAFQTLWSDSALQARLSAGAVQRRSRLSVQRWADELLDGAPSHRIHPLMGSRGPWFVS